MTIFFLWQIDVLRSFFILLECSAIHSRTTFFCKKKCIPFAYTKEYIYIHIHIRIYCKQRNSWWWSEQWQQERLIKIWMRNIPIIWGCITGEKYSKDILWKLELEKWNKNKNKIWMRQIPQKNEFFLLIYIYMYNVFYAACSLRVYLYWYYFYL